MSLGSLASNKAVELTAKTLARFARSSPLAFGAKGSEQYVGAARQRPAGRTSMAQKMSSVTVIDVSRHWASPPPPALMAWRRDKRQLLGDQDMRLPQQWWSGLVAAVFGGLVGVTAGGGSGRWGCLAAWPGWTVDGSLFARPDPLAISVCVQAQ